MKTYKNPFSSEKSTKEITTDAKPIEYRGYLIYQRITGSVWDIVKDGICIGMYAGLNGAKRRIDLNFQ